MERKIPNKLFFKIGEVCEITDTQPYVLRYWESEFPALAPAKNSSGQRIYRRRDIETVLRIKQLLYEEGFTIAGAKKRLEAEMAGRSATPGNTPPAQTTPPPVPAGATMTPPPPTIPPTPQPALVQAQQDRTREVLREMRVELRAMLTLLERNDKKRG